MKIHLGQNGGYVTDYFYNYFNLGVDLERFWIFGYDHNLWFISYESSGITMGMTMNLTKTEKVIWWENSSSEKVYFAHELPRTLRFLSL